MPDSSPDAAAQAADNLIDTAVDTPAENTADHDSTTESSPSSPAGSMLDAVEAALAPKAESPTATNSDQAEKPDSDAAKPAGEAGDEELSPDELKALSWKAQQRFRKLASAAKAKDGEIAGLKTKADEHDRMVAAVTKAGLDGKELDELVELGSVIKTDPVVALQRLMPLVKALEQVAGKVLPADLQEEVRLGYISEPRARELAESRAQAHLAKQSQERMQRDDEAAKKQREINDRVNSSVSAVEAWEKQQASSDPDWPSKRQLVAEQVELMIGREAQRRGEPYFPDVQECVKLSKDALKIVQDRIAKLKPRPTEVRPPVNPGASARGKAAPATMLDAINSAL